MRTVHLDETSFYRAFALLPLIIGSVAALLVGVFDYTSGPLGNLVAYAAFSLFIGGGPYALLVFLIWRPLKGWSRSGIRLVAVLMPLLFISALSVGLTVLNRVIAGGPWFFDFGFHGFNLQLFFFCYFYVALALASDLLLRSSDGWDRCTRTSRPRPKTRP